MGSKNNTSGLTYKRENRLTHNTESKLRVAKGERLWGGVSQESGINLHALLYIKQKTNKDLQDSTGSSTQHAVMACTGKQPRCPASETRLPELCEA